MGLKGEIQDAMKAAMKGGDRLTLSALRLLLSALHNEEIKERRELSPEEIIKIISSLCKQGQESIEYFRKGGRAQGRNSGCHESGHEGRGPANPLRPTAAFIGAP